MWQVIGQTRAVSLLQRSLEGGSLAHAYLFVGPAHVGKMTLALTLAQALNCEGDKSPFTEVYTERSEHARGGPCGRCLSCMKIDTGKHADVQTIVLNDETSEENRAKIGVSQIEEVQHSASLPPFEGRHKVFIIDGAEFLSIGAANRLLKTLEEPVGRVAFILLTIDDRLLLPTIVSRCQRLELSLVPADKIASALRERGAELERAGLLARLAHGCPGWAFSAASDGAAIQQRSEWLDRLSDTLSADGEERFACAAQLATEFGQKRALVYEKLNLWLEWWRDLLLAKVGLTDSVINVDRLEELSRGASGFSLAQIGAFIRSLRAAAGQLRQNANPRLVLEVLMLNIPDAEKQNGVNCG